MGFLSPGRFLAVRPCSDPNPDARATPADTRGRGGLAVEFTVPSPPGRLGVDAAEASAAARVVRVGSPTR